MPLKHSRAVPKGYKLLWNDEFDGKNLDLTKWEYRYLGEKGGARDVACDAADSAAAVVLPQGEVKQVLYNLLRNAIQASPPAGEVSVRIEHGADEVTVEVQDRGAGISADIMPFIFDPFFSTKQGDLESGMGLGLSVSRSLIEAMGGRIEVTSEVGHGSLSAAIFPLRVATSQDSAHD